MFIVEIVIVEVVVFVFVLLYLFYLFDMFVYFDVDCVEVDLFVWMNVYGLFDDLCWVNGICYGKVGEYCLCVYVYVIFDGLCMMICVYGWIFVIDDGLCSLYGVVCVLGEFGVFYLWLYEMIVDLIGYDLVLLCVVFVGCLLYLVVFLFVL